MEHVYDLIIIGAGPAGLAASLYASRYKLEHLVLGAVPGGQMSEINTIENWPGETSISGAELISKFVAQVESYGVKLTNESVSSMKKLPDGNFEIATAGKTYNTKAIILAMGAEYKRINIPGEKELVGRGVSYCATCDAFFFKGKTVSVVGGGNSAAVAALELAEIVGKVYMIFRRDRLTAEPYWIEKINANPKIELLKETNIIEIKGENKVEKIILDKPHNDKTYLSLDGVFVEIGSEPGVALAQKLGVVTDDGNYIKVEENMSTNVPGVFAAGDITTGSNKFRQVLTAMAEGSIAASSAYKMLKLK